jgi:predicted O-methyltransferase YrrM
MISKEIFKIPSTTLPSECHTIMDLALRLPPYSVVVETGTGAGRVTVVLAGAIAGKGSILYTVDDYSLPEKYNEFGSWDRDSAKKWAAKFKCNGHIRYLEGKSEVEGNNFKSEIDMLYLDGAHNYLGVCAEMDAWLPHVKKGGIISGHDFDPNCNDGRNVIKAIFDKLLVNPDLQFQTVGRVWWMEKV